MLVCGPDEEIQKFVTLLKQEISLEEKVMIFKAMGLSAVRGSFGGHWYTCSNGHLYTVGECGGAMERGICPECKEQIGVLAGFLNYSLVKEEKVTC